MSTEVVLSASSTDSTIYVWDIRTGSSLFSFKQSMSQKGGLTLVHKPGGSFQIDSIVTAQTDRAVLNVYQWQRDQVLHKMTTNEKMISVASSHQGRYLAAATATGKVYIWHIPTGHLLRVFEAHYRKITKLAFSYDDTVLLTASEDAAVNVWLLAHLVQPMDGNNAYEDMTARPSPLYQWSDHTLPVSDVFIGAGTLSSARVCTASLDHTVKLWDLATGHLLTTFLFPKGVTSVVMNPSETTLFAACEDNKIYTIDLYKRREDQSYKVNTVESLGGMSRVESVGIKSVATPVAANTSQKLAEEEDTGSAYVGHTDKINSLTLSFDGTVLISGSEDGNCIVWDVLSRQLLRKFEMHKGPVTHVSCFLKPLQLHSEYSNSTMQQQLNIPMPWKPLSRALATAEAERRDAAFQVLPSTTMDLEQHSFKSVEAKPALDAACIIREMKDDSTAGLQNQVNALQSELLRLNDHFKKVRSLHNEMYETIVDQFMEERRAKRKLEEEDSDNEQEDDMVIIDQ